MIENLNNYMRRYYNYKMIEYKACSSKREKSKLFLLPVSLFFVVGIGLILQIQNVIFVASLPIFIIIGIILIIYQIILIYKNSPEVLVITPEFMIKCVGKKRFIAIEFDEIRKFQVTNKDEIVISDRRNELLINTNYRKDDLGQIVDILEAKGKTFDKSREFMKRPIRISIVDNEIDIEDVKQEESTTEKLIGKYYQDYQMLTPGFISDVLFVNSIVEDVYALDNNLILKLNKIEVKEGHPENIGFDSIIASDCILIFENVNIKYVNTKEVRNEDAIEVVLDNDVDSLVSRVKKGVIANWKYRKNGVDLHFAVRLELLKTSLDYREVIIGWNSSK